MLNVHGTEEQDKGGGKTAPPKLDVWGVGARTHLRTQKAQRNIENKAISCSVPAARRRHSHETRTGRMLNVHGEGRRASQGTHLAGR
jgi:hypothetical protein